jgi:hypothetical protein
MWCDVVSHQISRCKASCLLACCLHARMAWSSNCVQPARVTPQLPCLPIPKKIKIEHRTPGRKTEDVLAALTYKRRGEGGTGGRKARAPLYLVRMELMESLVAPWRSGICNWDGQYLLDVSMVLGGEVRGLTSMVWRLPDLRIVLSARSSTSASFRLASSGANSDAKLALDAVSYEP